MMIGQRFGSQVVLELVGNGKAKIQCDCGTVKETRIQYLLSGESTSCGCGRYRDILPPIQIGDKFNLLTVVQKLGTDGHKRQVLCLCNCGTYKVFNESDIRSETTKSCGCFRRQRAANLTKTHGQGGRNKTYLYRAWLAMKERVRRSDRWPTYQENNIKVCPEWENSFEAFRDYVLENLGERPEKYSLDRINNMKNYEPGNIRWASAKEQANNRRSNVILTVNGTSRSLKEWSELTGIPLQQINKRRKEVGLSDYEILYGKKESK